MGRYVIGVDGGNTKTDYFLFDLNGAFVDSLRGGTSSHERLGYKGAGEELRRCTHTLLTRNGLTVQNVVSGAFGLAGIDHTHQQEKLSKIISRLGFTRFEADNDSFLGIAAGTTQGYGICSINGTGTVSGGIDPEGNRLQVGGIGFLVGDDAGGSYIARRGVRAVYDSFYRCGDRTAMAEPVFELFGINDKRRLMRAIADKDAEISSTRMARIVFDAADAGDKAALDILNDVGVQLAKTSAGCVRNLSFGARVEVVLAGSVWQKANSKPLFSAYKQNMRVFLPDKELLYHVLTVPPATGAVLWAMALAGVNPYEPAFKSGVVQAVERALAEKLS